MTTTHTECSTAVRTVSKAHVIDGLQMAVNTVFTWATRARQRRELRDLLSRNDYVLRDIGLERHDILREASKSFWQD